MQEKCVMCLCTSYSWVCNLQYYAIHDLPQWKNWCEVEKGHQKIRLLEQCGVQVAVDCGACCYSNSLHGGDEGKQNTWWSCVYGVIQWPSPIPCSSWLTSLERIERMVGITMASNDNTTPTAKLIFDFNMSFYHMVWKFYSSKLFGWKVYKFWFYGNPVLYSMSW